MLVQNALGVLKGLELWGGQDCLEPLQLDWSP